MTIFLLANNKTFGKGPQRAVITVMTKKLRNGKVKGNESKLLILEATLIRNNDPLADSQSNIIPKPVFVYQYQYLLIVVVSVPQDSLEKLNYRSSILRY